MTRETITTTNSQDIWVNNVTEIKITINNTIDSSGGTQTVTLVTTVVQTTMVLTAIRSMAGIGGDPVGLITIQETGGLF